MIVVDNESLASATLNALQWRYGGAAIQGGIQFAIGVVLARLLSPEAFGVVGIALIAIGFGRLVGDFGFGAAIIQHPNLTPRHVRAALTGAMLVSSFLFSILWLLAPAIAHLFGQAALRSILRVLAVSLVFSAMSVTLVCLLRQQLRFRALSIIESLSYLVGFGAVGISMAVLGYGAWSLVAANVVQPCCVLVLSVMITKQSLWPYFRLQEYRDLFRFASADALNNVVNFTAENLPHVVIANWLSATALGLYNRSFNVMDLPVRYFSFALSNVLFPVYAKIQGDVPRLGRAFLRSVSFTAFVTVPMFFAMAAVPGIIIGGVFGEQWKPGTGTFQVLCIAGPFMAMMLVFGSVSHSLGYVFNECSRQGVYLMIMSAALGFLLPLGLKGVAIAVMLATIARYLLLAHLSLKLVRVGWKQFFIAQAPGYLLGLIASASAYLVSALGDAFGMSDILQLLIIIPICGMSLCAAFFLLPLWWFGDLYPWVLERFGMKFPRRVRKLLMLRASM